MAPQHNTVPFREVLGLKLQIVVGDASVCSMKQVLKKVTMKDRLEEAIDEIGGEPLAGSGFEDEKPEEGFSGAVLLDSTFLPGKPTRSHSDLQ
jgi:hypothetical protein